MNLLQLEIAFDKIGVMEELPACAEFSRERLCLAWVTESDGRAWLDWWQGLANYERNAMLAAYDAERAFANACRCRMRPYRSIEGEARALAEQDESISAGWAVEIKQAAVERRPVPFHEPEDATPRERQRFQGLLRRAFEIAGVVLIAPPADIPPEKGRRRRSPR